MFQFEHPAILFLIPIVIVLVFILVRTDFGKVKAIRGRFRVDVKKRLLFIISRSLILSLLVIAAASPFSLDTVFTAGDPTLTILIDNSSSMQLIDTSAVESVVAQLQKSLPLRVRTFGSSESSSVGDAIISNIDGDDNVLLISDAQSHSGRSLGDMLVLASSLNSTVSALELPVINDDTSVDISGPRITTNAEDNSFDIIVRQAGSEKEYTLTVSIDDEVIFNDEYKGSKVAEISSRFSEGYHVIKAQIAIDDHFPQNNIFLKTIKVEPKPRVLLVRNNPTPVSTIVTNLYDASVTSSLSAQSLSPYSAIILVDLPEHEIDANKLSTYVIDGNGLVLFGGKNSFDRGEYKDSLLEGMLPVSVGKGSEGKRTDVNIALVIDISGSTGAGFSKDSKSKIEEVEKALAIGVLNDLKNNDKVSVVAFNTESYIVSDLVPILGNRQAIADRIGRLVYKGGTRIDEGIKAARKIMAPLEGSKNMIIFSDGKSGSYSQDIYDAKISANTGIKIYTVGVGEGTNSQHLKEIASVGNGFYLEPSETERLKVLFGDSDSLDSDTFPLQIVNGHHFITRGSSLSGKVSGYNQVVPKTNADLLIATQSNNPILTSSRLGLGRIVAVTTDDGSAWAGELYGTKNSGIISKAINWAVGDLSRNKAFDVDIKDISLGDDLVVRVTSDNLPEHSELVFAKVAKRSYVSTTNPQNTGITKYLGGIGAVNYPEEYKYLGISPGLEESVATTGGNIFTPSQISGILDKVKQDSERIVSRPVSHSWIFFLAALVLLLVEVVSRKIAEGKIHK